MTAFTTCPFFTFDSGVASFTEAVTMSPSLAYRPVDPPIGLMTAILRAPELSATSRMDRIWIMTVYPPCPARAAGANAGSRAATPRSTPRSRRASLNLYRLPHDALQRPALAAAERTRLHDLDEIA